MIAEESFEKWWEEHRKRNEPECGDVQSAFLAGRKAGMEEAAEIVNKKAQGIRDINTYRGKVNATALQGIFWLNDVEAAIRSRMEIVCST